MLKNSFIDRVPLQFMPGNRWVYIRELCGHNEQAIRETRSIDAIRLVDGIIEDISGSAIGRGQASKLTIADRDRILLAVYTNTYTSKIATTVTCKKCDKPYDIDFSLEAVLESIQSKRNLNYTEVNGIYVIEYANGHKFRFPTGEDELAIMDMNDELAESSLLERCIMEGNSNEKIEELQDTMQDIAPLLNMEFSSQCPECGDAHSLLFDMQQYLLSSLIQEQKQLVYEVHQLARAYSWGLNEILALPRSIRRSYVSLNESG